MEEQVHTAYCKACNDEVEILFISEGMRGEEVPRCAICGADIASDKVSTIKQGELSDLVFIAGYCAEKADLLEKSLLEGQIATKVARCESGEDLIMKLVMAIRRRKPPRLIILETNMPIMNGINSALCIRAIEKGLGIKPPTHILFFTSKELDDGFKKAIKFLKPAKYVPIDRSSDKRAFSERVGKMTGVLAREHW